MAMRIQMNYSSLVLRFNTEIDIVVPQRGNPYDREKKSPVMFLLHGGGSSHSDWLRNTRIEELAEKHDIIVVCPDGQNSSWSDMYMGAEWFTYVTTELYDFVHTVLPGSKNREDNIIAGLSMGGHGALKAGLTCPEKYGFVIGLSSAAGIAQECAEGRFPLPNNGYAIFGEKEQVLGGKNDLFALADRLKESGKEAPVIYSACGTEDFTYSDNVKLKDHMQTLELPVTFVDGPGAHTWDFWNEYIEKALEFVQKERGGATV